MLLIFGTRVSERIINLVSFVCAYCHVRAPRNVIQRRNRFTLFFVPLFAVSTKYVNQCTSCGGLTDLTAEQAKRSTTWAGTAQRRW